MCCAILYLDKQQIVVFKEAKSMKLTSKQILALKRKQGERSLTNIALASEIGVSRYTIGRIINDDNHNLTPTTAKKVNDWIIDQYTTIK